MDTIPPHTPIFDWMHANESCSGSPRFTKMAQLKHEHESEIRFAYSKLFADTIMTVVAKTLAHPISNFPYQGKKQNDSHLTIFG